jgi:hypothetical protein
MSATTVPAAVRAAPITIPIPIPITITITVVVVRAVAAGPTCTTHQVDEGIEPMGL